MPLKSRVLSLGTVRKQLTTAKEKVHTIVESIMGNVADSEDILLDPAMFLSESGPTLGGFIYIVYLYRLKSAGSEVGEHLKHRVNTLSVGLA